MNKKRIVAVLSMAVIIVGIVVFLMLPKEKKEVTEEDYKENPKYILEETIVSNGKHFEYPKVRKVLDYWYYEKRCSVEGVVELSKKEYNAVIKQLDEELNIPRYEESEYKNIKHDMNRSHYVDGIIVKEDRPTNDPLPREFVNTRYANVTYIMKSSNSKYQTKGLDEMYIGIFMTEKYDKYYMQFVRMHEYAFFRP